MNAASPSSMKNVSLLLGRILIVSVFMISAVGQLGDILQVEKFMSTYGLPAIPALFFGSILVRFTGGVLVLAGYKTTWGAAILIAFLVLATLIFHTTFNDPAAVLAFVENLGLLGGLLVLLGSGPGRFSVDQR